ncbi:Transient receptor potential cation channel subfamily A member 1-like protein [Trichoplax sp. H2]|nr:Transient receptor potential cation channel subfamily A member 1-like protein [Trichoplax sp. H2]|eukprot:RDD37564.1 Transient receptor potential cation channel subfamily A member 1-like protein [Trichoplax sp. H2]
MNSSPTEESQVQVDVTAYTETSMPSSTENTYCASKTLHEAARKGLKQDIEYLITTETRGLDEMKKNDYINQRDKKGVCPIHYAMQYNKKECFKILVDNGANVFVKDKDEATPLHYAAKFYRPTRTEDQSIQKEEKSSDDKVNDPTACSADILCIFKKWEDINMCDKYGFTPMNYAAERGNQHVCNYLLSQEDHRNKFERSQLIKSLHLAISKAHLEVTEMLLKRLGDILCRDDDQLTPMHIACIEGHLNTVKELAKFIRTSQSCGHTLLEILNATDNKKYTPLHYAADNRHTKVVEFLLEEGANVNAEASNGVTPLHLAAARNKEIVMLLINNGAKVNAKTIKLQTPLHRAASYNKLEIIKYLIQKQANIEATDQQYCTPLLCATVRSHVEAIKALLNNRANILATDYRERNSVYWATQKNRSNILKHLLKENTETARALLDTSDDNNNYPLHIACQEGYAECVKVLLSYDAQINARNGNEMTPLHLAASKGRTKTVRILVNHKRSILYDRDGRSNTPLHLAAIAGHTEVLSVLLRNGAAVDVRNIDGKTPLACAAANGRSKAIELLLAADSPIDPNHDHKVNIKTTPLHLAAQNGHTSCVQLLLQKGADATLTDTTGRNCLDMAIDEGHRETSMAIINHEKWKELLRNPTVSATGNIDTPLRKLIRKLPDVAEIAFNKCITKESTGDSNYAISFRYEFLDDTLTNWFKSFQAESTEDPCYNNANAHPLVKNFLSFKWKQSGRYIYYTNLILYVFYLIFLTAFAIENPRGTRHLCFLTMQVNSTNENNAANLLSSNTTNQIDYSKIYFICASSVIVSILAAVRLAFELFQFLYQRRDYVTVENLLEIICYIMTLIFTLPVNYFNSNSLSQIGAVSVFLSWFNLALFARIFPRFGIYVLMFIDLCITFAESIIIFLLIMTGFGISFFLLLQNHKQFSSAEAAWSSTAIMTIDSVDFRNIFFNDNVPILHKAATIILYAIFIIFIRILLVNLLTGLAVDDIKKIRNQATFKHLKMQVDLALDVDELMPDRLRQKFWNEGEKVPLDGGSPLTGEYSKAWDTLLLSRVDSKAKKIKMKVLTQP